MIITKRTRHIDNKGDDFDLEFRAPANGKLPLRRVVVGCLLCMIDRSKEYDPTFDESIETSDS